MSHISGLSCGDGSPPPAAAGRTAGESSGRLGRRWLRAGPADGPAGASGAWMERLARQVAKLHLLRVEPVSERRSRRSAECARVLMVRGRCPRLAMRRRLHAVRPVVADEVLPPSLHHVGRVTPADRGYQRDAPQRGNGSKKSIASKRSPVHRCQLDVSPLGRCRRPCTGQFTSSPLARSWLTPASWVASIGKVMTRGYCRIYLGHRHPPVPAERGFMQPTSSSVSPRRGPGPRNAGGPAPPASPGPHPASAWSSPRAPRRRGEVPETCRTGSGCQGTSCR